MLINIDDQNSKLEVDIDRSASQEGKQQLLNPVANYESKKYKKIYWNENILNCSERWNADLLKITKIVDCRKTDCWWTNRPMVEI